jgi:hypothetical protein
MKKQSNYWHKANWKREKCNAKEHKRQVYLRSLESERMVNGLEENGIPQIRFGNVLEIENCTREEIRKVQGAKRKTLSSPSY